MNIVCIISFVQVLNVATSYKKSITKSCFESNYQTTHSICCYTVCPCLQFILKFLNYFVPLAYFSFTSIFNLCHSTLIWCHCQEEAILYGGNIKLFKWNKCIKREKFSLLLVLGKLPFCKIFSENNKEFLGAYWHWADFFRLFLLPSSRILPG